jgi:cell division septation protein DedD
MSLVLLGLSCSGPSPDDTASEEPRPNRARGYHVQLDMTKKKDTANQVLGRALEWWRANGRETGIRPSAASSASPVTVVWRAPLYRIRIGPFATKSRADSVLHAAQSAFPGAFVRPAAPSRP